LYYYHHRFHRHRSEFDAPTKTIEICTRSRTRMALGELCDVLNYYRYVVLTNNKIVDRPRFSHFSLISIYPRIATTPEFVFVPVERNLLQNNNKYITAQRPRRQTTACDVWLRRELRRPTDVIFLISYIAIMRIFYLNIIRGLAYSPLRCAVLHLDDIQNLYLANCPAAHARSPCKIGLSIRTVLRVPSPAWSSGVRSARRRTVFDGLTARTLHSGDGGGRTHRDKKILSDIAQCTYTLRLNNWLCKTLILKTNTIMIKYLTFIVYCWVYIINLS